MCIEHQEELDFLARKLLEENLKSKYFIGLEKKIEGGHGYAIVLVYDDIPCDHNWDHNWDYICERRLSSCHKQGWLKTPEMRSLTGASRLPLSLSLSL